MRTSRGPDGERLPPVRKSLGQHFLTDRSILERIAGALQLTGTETVVEIGPGRGSLSDVLAEQSGRLVLIEYDRALAALLRTRYAARTGIHIEVVQADVLEVDLAAAAGGGAFRLVGNVPYNVTTPIVFHGLERPRPELAVYLMQREVAERIVAPAGSKVYGALSVNVQAVARSELLFRVPAGAFQPPPKVESAVVRIVSREDPVISPAEEPAFKRLVQSAFGMRRKQIKRIIRELYRLGPDEAERALADARIEGDRRPETLDPEDFARLLRQRLSRDS
ncbi:MAG TPA: 16S rRNA (adenine(1518)-N(6)/adenine(1519)-N(6))-dimethyltransferase RsmA [Gemmatimonadaceae bacterium]|nr:16S rRNA (adenine(1518)-N(6)/adenine(1519)-N(6))-dimethyltransferase RsmA [Gemmatimonadaceae bacterium]